MKKRELQVVLLKKKRGMGSDYSISCQVGVKYFGKITSKNTHHACAVTNYTADVTRLFYRIHEK